MTNAVARALEPWCRAQLSATGRRPWVLGLQGPQGCGKSTGAAALVEAFGAGGMRAVTVSIDDFYLTYGEQRALAERHAGNPYLLYRGYPGTHDVALGGRVIDALVAAAESGAVAVPVYDKSAHGGRGDRAPESAWRRVRGPFDVVIVEGWMLGFAASSHAVADPELAAADRYLAAYRAWNERLDALAHLTVESLDTIVAWRVDSERARRQRGETALSDDDAADYIRRFLPAYRLYVPKLEARPPCAVFGTWTLAPNRTVL